MAGLEILRVWPGRAVHDRCVLVAELIDRLFRIPVAAELKVVVREVIERVEVSQLSRLSPRLYIVV
jgi:hypothetical protein